jgi:hypothetical protein
VQNIEAVRHKDSPGRRRDSGSFAIYDVQEASNGTYNDCAVCASRYCGVFEWLEQIHVSIGAVRDVQVVKPAIRLN